MTAHPKKKTGPKRLPGFVRTLTQRLGLGTPGPGDFWGTTLDAIEDWICIIDTEARILRSNKAVEHLFDTPALGISGTTCCRLLHNTPSPIPGCPLSAMMVSLKRENAEIEVKDGQWMLITVDPIFNPRGKVIGAVHIARDITRRILIQNEREHLVRDLKEALSQIKTLSGLIPICSHCKKIRDDKGYWNLIESYVESHSHASFSHGLCPDCMEGLYSEEDWYQQMKEKKAKD